MNFYMKNASRIFSLVMLWAVAALATVTVDVDYTVDAENACSFNIKTANGLQNISELPADYCVSPEYNLANDIVVSSGTQGASCETNWDNANASFKGTFNGNGFKISGVCLNETNKVSVYLFNILYGANIFNVSFENIYLGLDTESAGVGSISLFNGFSESITYDDDFVAGLAYTFDNVSLSGITLSGNLKNSVPAAGLLVSYVVGKTFVVNDVKIEKSNIEVEATVVGALFGSIYADSVMVQNVDVNGNISVSNTSTEKAMVGGIAGFIGGRSISMEYDTAFATINVVGVASVGGLLGQSVIEGKSLSVHNSLFKGSISGSGDESYYGGLVGYISRSGDASSVEFNTVSAESATGSTGSLIDVNSVGAKSAGLAANNDAKTAVYNSRVYGSISNSGDNSVSAGLFGEIYSATNIYYSRYIGALTASTVRYFVGNFNITPTYLKTFALDLNAASNNNVFTSGESSSYVATGVSNSSKAFIHSNGTIVGEAYPNSPEFASLMEMAIGEDGYPIVPTTENPPVKHLLGKAADDVVYDVYTGVGGKVAYKADGSAFTAEDYSAIVWPSSWPDAWKFSMSGTYGANQIFISEYNGDDYDLSGCTLNFKSARALMGMDTIEIPGCSSKAYGLAQDIVLSTAEQKKGCVSNWDNSNTSLNTAFMGNDHKISGICLNETDKRDVYLFDVSGGGAVLNLNIENVYVGVKKESMNGDYNISLFKTATSTSSNYLTFSGVNVKNTTLDGELGDSYGNVGLFMSMGYNPITIVNSKVENASINIESTGSVYAGTLIGYNYSTSVSIPNDTVSSTMNINSPSGYHYIGGLVGASQKATSLSISSAKLESSINAVGSSVYGGGFVGYASIPYSSSTVANFGISNSTFVGNFTADVKSSYSASLGGLVGYKTSGKNCSLNISGVKVESPTGAEGALISVTNMGYYIGGVIGSNSGKVGVHSAEVKGSILYPNATSNTYAYAAGLIGFTNDTTYVTNSRYFGSLPPVRYVYGLTDEYSSDSYYSNSYAIDYAGNAKEPVSNNNKGVMHFVGIGSEDKELAKVYNEGVISGYAYPKTPGFAYMLRMVVGEDGYPRFAQGSEDIVHRVMGALSTDTLFEAYTDKDGMIAYKADGSSYTAADLNAIEWPDASVWDPEWKPDLSMVYSSDVTYSIEYLIGKDYEVVNGCEISIKTPRGLENIGDIDVEGCSELSYSLANDITFREESQKSDCLNNWSLYNKNFSGSFDGKGYTISGICYKPSNVNNPTFLFNLVGSSSISNVNFSNFYLDNDQTSKSMTLDAGLFHIPQDYDASNQYSFKNINISNVEVYTTNYGATIYTGMLAGTIKNNVSVENVSVNNSIVKGDGSSVYSGGLFGRIMGGNAEIKNVSYNTSKAYGSGSYQTYTGGLVGYETSAVSLLSIEKCTFDNMNAYGVTSYSSATTSDVYAGGLVGKADAPVSFVNNVVKTDVYARSSSPQYAGGIAGRVFSSDLIFENDSVIGNIYANGNSSSASHYLGGIFGYVYSNGDDTLTIRNPTYQGTIKAAPTSTYSKFYYTNAYYGGVVGYVYGSSSTFALDVTGAIVKSPTATPNDSIISSNPYSATYTYMGGVVGYSTYPVDIYSSYVVGSMKMNAKGTRYAAGAVGYMNSKALKIRDFAYVGAIPNASYKYGLANEMNGLSHADYSYVVDLNGYVSSNYVWSYYTITNHVGVGHSLTGSMTIKNGSQSIIDLKPGSIEFARELDFSYDEERGYALPLIRGQTPMRHLYGESRNGILYDVYTNNEGLVSYKKNGSAFTAEDLAAIKWPDNWPDEWKIDLSTVYTEDATHLLDLTEDDRKIAGCDVNIYTAWGLKKSDELSVDGCDSLTFNLKNDIELSSEIQNSSCVTNWNTLILNGNLDGQGHSISGICINEEDRDETYVFDVSGGATISNLKFKNIYLGSDRGSSTKPYAISLFKADGDKTNKVAFSNITIENMNVYGNQKGANDDVYRGFASLLVAKSTGELTIDSVNVSGSSIDATGFIYVGSLVGQGYGDTKNITNSSVKANLNLNVNGFSYVGGLVGGSKTNSSYGTNNLNFENASFEGTIKVNLNGSVTSYTGGIVGFHTGSKGGVSMQNVSARSASGYSGDLISCDGNLDYVGGLIGTAQPNNYISYSSVEGNITRDPSATGYYVGGLIGNYNDKLTSFYNSFIGGLPSKAYGVGYGYNSSDTLSKVYNTYAVDLNSNVNYLVYKTSVVKTKAALIGTPNLVDSVDVTVKNEEGNSETNYLSLTSPVFAHKVGMLYQPGKNNNMPIPPLKKELHTHKILWNSEDGEQIFEAYTDGEGKIAYKPDGTTISEEDIPEGVSIDFETVHLHDVTYGVSKAYNSVDYAVNGCQTTIKSAAGLNDVMNVPYNSECDTVALVLDHDISLGEDASNGCTLGAWDPSTAVIPTESVDPIDEWNYGHYFVLDGDGHKISDVCLNGKPYMFDISNKATVKNLVLENIIVANSSNDQSVSASLFKGGDSYVTFEDVKFKNITVSASGGFDYAGNTLYIGAGLIASSAKGISLNGVVAENVSVVSYSAYMPTSGRVIAGGFIGSVGSYGYSVHNSSFNGSVSVNGNSELYSAYVGGMIADAYSVGPESGTFTDNTVNASISAYSTVSTSYVGGFIGRCKLVRPENLVFKGSITSTKGVGYVGGVVGAAEYSVFAASTGFRNIRVESDREDGILYSGNHTNVGGVAGYLSTGGLVNSVVKGIIDNQLSTSSAGAYVASGPYDGSYSVLKSALFVTINNADNSDYFFGSKQGHTYNSYVVTDGAYPMKGYLNYVGVASSSDEKIVVKKGEAEAYEDLASVSPRSPTLVHWLNMGLNGQKTGDEEEDEDEDYGEKENPDEGYEECDGEECEGGEEWAAAPKLFRAPAVRKAPEETTYEGFYYDPENEYPAIITTAGIQPTHKVTWVDGTDVIEAYTDVNGMLAYAADGSSLYDSDGNLVDGLDVEIPVKSLLIQAKKGTDAVDSVVVWETAGGDQWNESRSITSDISYIRRAAPTPVGMEFEVALGDVSMYKPFFKVEDIPATYTIGDALNLPAVGAMGLCHVGWEITRDGEAYGDAMEMVNDAYQWTAEVGSSGNIVVTPVFEEGDCETRTITIALTTEIDGVKLSDLAELVVKYGDEVLTATQGVITVPYVKGLTLSYEITPKENEDYEFKKVVLNKAPATKSGTITLEENVVFGVTFESTATEPDEDPEEPDTEPDTPNNPEEDPQTPVTPVTPDKQDTVPQTPVASSSSTNSGDSNATGNSSSSNGSTAPADRYSVDKVIVSQSGSAARFNVKIAEVEATSPVALRVKLYKGAELVKEIVVAEKAEAKEYPVDIFPLAPGEYHAVAVLDGAGKSVTADSKDIVIAEEAKTVESGSWYMMSMAGVADSYKFPDYSEAAFYSWNEDFPIGEYMQYERLVSMKDVDATAGYWIYTSEPLVLKATDVKDVQDSIRWNLKKHYTGWNLVANPYSWMVKVGDFDLKNPNDSTQVPWKWNSQKQRYDVANELDVYEAMWIYTTKNREYTLSSEPFFADTAALASKKAAYKVSKNAWSLSLSLEGTNGVSDTWNVIGHGSRDISLPKPPAMVGEGLSLEIKDGDDVLAKSIKASGNLSWNVELSSAVPQNAKFSIEGLADIEQLGLNAYLEMDGSVIQLSSAEPLEVSLGATPKKAVLKVSSSPVVAKANALSELRYSVRGGKLAVNFYVNEASAKSTVIALYDAQGHVLAQKKEESYVGLHEVTFENLRHSGVGILRVSSGNKTLTGKVKF